MADYDFERLSNVMERNLEHAYRTYKESFPGHRLYGFGPYTTGDLSYFLPVAFSDIGLSEAVRAYRERPRFATLPADELGIRLKWSTCDSPLYDVVEFDAELQDISAALGRFLDDAFEEDEEAFDDDEDHEDEAFESGVEAAHLAVSRALLSLDAREVFGRGDARPLLNLWYGDQTDEERLRLAAALNPPEALERFRADLKRRASLL